LFANLWFRISDFPAKLRQSRDELAASLRLATLRNILASAVLGATPPAEAYTGTTSIFCNELDSGFLEGCNKVFCQSLPCRLSDRPLILGAIVGSDTPEATNKSPGDQPASAQPSFDVLKSFYTD
jgi:hypothetical protein